MAIGTVITADIVNSTQLPKAVFNKLVKTIESLMGTHKFEFYRGDSFQVYMKDNEKALNLLLQIRLAAIRIENETGSIDVRAGIGIGHVKAPIRILKTSGEEPFVISGLNLDSLSGNDRLRINSFNDKANCAFQTIAPFLDYILKRLTAKQAGVLFELWMGHNQTEIAKKLKKSQVTINKQIHAADWQIIDRILFQYKHTLDQFNLK